MKHARWYILLILVSLLAVPLLTACGGGDAAPLEPTVRPTVPPTVPPTAAPTTAPEPTAASGSEQSWTEYASSDGVFHMRIPSTWVVNEVPAGNGLAFAIAPSREIIDSRPDFSQPIAFAFGTIGQIDPSLAQPENLSELQRVGLLESSPFAFQAVGDPVVTQPSPYITYLLMQAVSTEADGSVIHWQLGTGLADLTVVHFGVGVTEAGMAELGQIVLDMFNSIEVDTLVTAELANP